ncbi:MAG: hypothetical protein PHS57_06150 [Alphaproteobacteria bacterium]|nr:hypothetical protein [Alphaproteobacteria bacterium]
MGNRVMLLAEVLALPEGKKVYVEGAKITDSQRYTSGVHTVRHNYREDIEIDEIYHGHALVDKDGYYWPLDKEGRTSYGKHYRVWVLPHRPTPEELIANAWPEVTNGID